MVINKRKREREREEKIYVQKKIKKRNEINEKKNGLIPHFFFFFFSFEKKDS